MARARRFCCPKDRASGGRARMSSSPSSDVRSRQSSTNRLEAGRIATEVPGPEQELLLDGPREQHLARALEHVAELGGQLGRGPGGDRRAVDEDDPVRDAQETHRCPEQRRLAGAVGSQDRDDLVGAQTGVDAMEDLVVADGCPHATELESRRLVRRSRRRHRLGVVVDRGHLMSRIVHRADPLEHDLERQLHGIRVGDGEESIDRAEVPLTTIFEVEDPVGPKLERLLHPVLDDDDRVAVVREIAQDIEQAFGGRWIEVGQRLVDHVQPRLHHEDPGHREQLAFAAGQGRRLAAQDRLDAGSGGDLADPVPDLGPRDAHVLRTERQLRLHGGPDDLLGRILEDRAHGPGDVAQLQLGRGVTLHPHRAGELARVRVGDEPVDGADERALAAARRPGDQDHLPGRDRQRQVRDGRFGSAAIAVGQAVDLDQRRRGRHRLQAERMWTGRSRARPSRAAALPWLSASER